MKIKMMRLIKILYKMFKYSKKLSKKDLIRFNVIIKIHLEAFESEKSKLFRNMVEDAVLRLLELKMEDLLILMNIFNLKSEI